MEEDEVVADEDEDAEEVEEVVEEVAEEEVEEEDLVLRTWNVEMGLFFHLINLFLISI